MRLHYDNTYKTIIASLANAVATGLVSRGFIFTNWPLNFSSWVDYIIAKLIYYWCCLKVFQEFNSKFFCTEKSILDPSSYAPVAARRYLVASIEKEWLICLSNRVGKPPSLRLNVISRLNVET